MAPEKEPLAVVPSTGDAIVERTSCLLCGAAPPERGGYSFPPFRVVRCPACGLWYECDRLAEASMLAAYGDEAYFEGAEGPGYASYLAQEATLRATFRHFLGAMARHGMTGGRLLEVGCAYGFFLDEAREAFDYRAGTDYSAAAAERARPLADRVYLGGLEAIPAGERFDCAVLVHVIEHIYDPVSLLAALHDRLRAGGWVVLAAPDMGGFWRHLLGRRWPFFKVPEHVAYFDRRTLHALLAKAGYVDPQPLPYASWFDLALVGDKLGVRVPEPLARWQLRLPATTVAAAARRPQGRSPAGEPCS